MSVRLAAGWVRFERAGLTLCAVVMPDFPQGSQMDVFCEEGIVLGLRLSTRMLLSFVQFLASFTSEFTAWKMRIMVPINTSNSSTIYTAN